MREVSVCRWPLILLFQIGHCFRPLLRLLGVDPIGHRPLFGVQFVLCFGLHSFEHSLLVVRVVCHRQLRRSSPANVAARVIEPVTRT